jgi:hypothetical protein
VFIEPVHEFYVVVGGESFYYFFFFFFFFQFGFLGFWTQSIIKTMIYQI